MSRTAACASRPLWPKSPRGRRVLLALLNGPLLREQVDRVAGASNGPQVVAGLRKLLGLSIPCEEIPSVDRDGHVTKPGQYSLSPEDRERALWLQSEVLKAEAEARQ